MAKKKSKAEMPQTQIAAATYKLSIRCTKVWIPLLEAKIEELRRRIDEKHIPTSRV